MYKEAEKDWGHEGAKARKKYEEVGELERGELEAVRGVVFDVQRYSLHDGPGVRTNVFLKGCPLRCGWCANPESQQLQPELMFHAHNCIECDQFAEPCTICWPRQAETAARAATDEDLAPRTAMCPTGAIHWAGAWRSAGEVMTEVLRDRPFYATGEEREHGGMTLTGGEPTMQPDFCLALLRLAKAEGVSTAMETCGHTRWALLERLLPHIDTLLFDLKHVDPVVHRRYTGLENGQILDNLRRAIAAGAPVRVRIPLIPGFNADAETLAAMADVVSSLPGPVLGVDLLPYHNLGQVKYAALGRAYPWQEHGRLSRGEVAGLAAVLEARQIRYSLGG